MKSGDALLNELELWLEIIEKIKDHKDCVTNKGHMVYALMYDNGSVAIRN